MPAWCKHYRAMAYHKTCEAGIRYEDVRHIGAVTEWPCFMRNGAHLLSCDKRVFPTAEELAEEDRRLAEWLKEFQRKLADNICPRCDTPIETKRQVGRCVYAYPCGCRLYQGRLEE